MRSVLRKLLTGGVVAALGGTAALGLSAPALAAPGDASARGVVVNLDAEVLADVVISADATVGEATAPPEGGTDTSTLVAIDLGAAVGVTASGTVDEVTATREPDGSSAESVITGLSLAVLGVDVLEATAVTAAVACPLVGDQSAETTLAGLELFGGAVDLEANGPAAEGSAAVTVSGVVDAELTVSLTRTETTTDDGAAAAAVVAEFTLSGAVGGELVTIPVGSLIVAEATCERPGLLAASDISPDAGPQSGGQPVTITGSGFVPGATTVTFDGVPATGVVVAEDGLSLTAVTPAGVVGPAEVVVTTFAGSAPPLDYTYLADGSDAEVTGLSPTSGPTAGGTTVTITGSGFTGATRVTFGGDPGTGFVVDGAATTVTVVTPPNPAGPTQVELIFPEGTVDAGTFTYLGPTIDSIVPDEGPRTGGTSVRITGSGFTTATGVTFGGVPGTDLVVAPGGTSLTVVTPAGSLGQVEVVVLTPEANAVAPAGFTYQEVPPVVESIDPDQGPTEGGTLVTVRGSGLVAGQTTVVICETTIPASEVTVSADGTSLTFVTPPCPPGISGIVIITPAGASDPVSFRYLGESLPATGSSLTRLLVAGAGMVIIGAVLLLLIWQLGRRTSVR